MLVSENAILNYLIENGPVVVVLGLVIYFLYRDNREALKYVRAQDRENLETLKDLSALLSQLVGNIDKTHNNIVTKVHDEAETTRKHVDQRIELLNTKLDNQQRPPPPPQ